MFRGIPEDQSEAVRVGGPIRVENTNTAVRSEGANNQVRHVRFGPKLDVRRSWVEPRRLGVVVCFAECGECVVE